MKDWKQIPSDRILKSTAENLNVNGFNTTIVESGEEAKKKALELIPQGSEVMTMTSVTLATLGLPSIFDESGKYNSIKVKLNKMDRDTQSLEMQKLGAAPEYSIGSVHAVTQDGKVLIASNSGSQLPGYLYGSSHVVWIVGAQKVVKDITEGEQRISEYTLPLETVRARKAYGLPADWESFVSKLVIYNREVNPSRINLILVKEELGF